MSIRIEHRLAAKYSLMVYDEERAGKDGILFNAGNQRLMIVILDNYLVVAFCGTDDVQDWLFNLNYRQTETDNGCRVHEGFDLAYRSLKRDINYYVNKFPDKRLVVTGHSLGGAIATRYALDCNHTNAVCVTFGAPRIGPDIKPYTRIRIIRYVNDADIVPHLPPCFLPISMLTYRHFAHETYTILNSGKVVEGARNWRWWKRKEWVADHNMIRYYEAFNGDEDFAVV
jgi:pimeloyl-ACP methyl ester carboxylesterase